MDLSNIKLVISEIDGIITEGLTGYGEMNIPLFKQFCMKDFEAINLIKKSLGFVFMSSDANINASMCKKRNIPFYFAERNKAEVFPIITQRFGLTPENVLYVGSSYSDVECMELAEVSVCPEDAVSEVFDIATVVLSVYSGAGVLCHLYEMINKLRTDSERGI